MAKLIPLEEAASILGISADELTELRSNNEVFGYRDGSSWKFKLSELERLAAERGMSLNLNDEIKAKSQESDIDLSAFDISDSADDIALSDDSLPRPDSPSSGGEALVLEGDDDDDILLESEEDVLGGEDALSFGESDLSLAASGDTGDLLDDDEPKSGSPSDTGKMNGGNDDDLLLSEDDLFSDELLLDDDSMGDSSELSSDFEDSDLIMDDSDSSAEIELAGVGGGTDLDLKASESGVSIDDEPLELGGSDIDSLELPEDDDMIVLDEPGDADSATVMQEDDFNLTPLEIDPEDESAGSQVIALEDSEIYADESSQTVLSASDAIEPGPQMLEDSTELDAYSAAAMGAGAVGLGAQGMVAQPQAAPDTAFTTANIVALGCTVAILCLGAAVAYDVARNIWQADTVLNSGVLSIFLELTGMDKFS